MSFNPVIINIEDSGDYNNKEKIYQLIVTLDDYSRTRFFLKKDPEWQLVDVARLLNIPCPVCRKDYYCSCMKRHLPRLEEQFKANIDKYADSLKFIG
ncbi:hypothetical protein DFQ01_11847 [Paenibacillus cellulosilyticus]|uniref:Uncharacterized protein n=1 Tax=Paenibacillus cellulosilyticus TaxID=375489 RepID=A0A2V2YYM5_9BACL|nr:hypothetical protein [Paenibacillus cellulosilyticus]PWV98412.1 hypothetical protein DFQ01_11847 [Paenibacillus cellulosilyticus]QKS43260.1 hypothetical protein HUB94_01945 [Paenibacillus cellulosilyticus]